MIIAGLQKTTLIDYPGKIACVVFLAGCNFRCPWCYSSELVLPLKIVKQPKIAEQEIFDFLRQRKGLLEGVVICGGEPTVNKDLPQFIKKIKNLGFLVKLDTNGSNPKMVRDLSDNNLLDYVAMDIKMSRQNTEDQRLRYKDIMGDGIKIEDIEETVKFLKSGKLDFEFRTTVVNMVHKKDDFMEIAKWIGGENVKYYLQNFRAEKTIDPDFERISPFPNDFLAKIAEEIAPFFKECKIR